MSPAPRPALSYLPTPLDEAHRLSDALGVRLLVKRDDLTGLALGGNKARKLDHLVADALARGCDVLVTGGGTQSNHVRQTAAAARRAGLECHAVLAGRAPATPTGNVLLDHLLGATITYCDATGYYDIERAIADVAAHLRQQGRRPYAIPIGGASAPGVRAYADAAQELLEQHSAVEWVFVADGSGGTHAGLLAGFGTGGPRVVGVDVGTRPDLDEVVPRLAHDVVDGDIADAVVDHDHAAPGYGALSEAALDALRFAARTEGLLLDPVYTAKAFAAMSAWIADRRVTPGATVCFWHTGGHPALFASRYATTLAAR